MWCLESAQYATVIAHKEKGRALAHYNDKIGEYEVVIEFTHKLGLPNKTGSSLFICKSSKQSQSTKPDGYYFYEGVTFILDAKAPDVMFRGQLIDYMNLESNTHFIGFEYNRSEFRCYVNGKLQHDELILQDKDYYRQKYFPKTINNELIISRSAKKLASLFRDSRINKQVKVPFIGVLLLCMKFDANILLTSTETILNSIKAGMNAILDNVILIAKKQKKESILKILSDSSLKKAKTEDIYRIVQEIATIYNFIHISADDYNGYDIMNGFLRVFRRWDLANTNGKGEVFTPDHIANLMYVLAQCSKENIVLDPTCGSGTFLTNAMANMLSETQKDRLCDTQKSIKAKQLIGIEDDEFNIALASINMILHGDSVSYIYYGNCFDLLRNFRNLYDRVLMNPPFAQQDLELKFVYETLRNMRDDGILASILPKSCVKGTESKNVKYLEKIFEIACLRAVVSLPSNLFYPVGANTCIVILHKSMTKDGQTLLINCLDDGFSVINESRVDMDGKWDAIRQEVIRSYLDDEFDEFRAIKKFDLKPSDELLFEAYSSHRPMDIDRKIFARYIRENIAAKILCNFAIKHTKLTAKALHTSAYGRFLIIDLIEKVTNGSEKSIRRTLEDKYDLEGIPLIIAKRDNNGVGGMKKNPLKTYNDKVCIIKGGDGGGGKTYYCDFSFCATSFVMICDFKNHLKNKLDKYAKYYICAVISERLHKTIAHGRTIADVPSEIEVKLPIKENGDLNFEFMSRFIKSLEFANFL